MKRKQFIAGLLGIIGIGKAQDWRACVGDPPQKTPTDPHCSPNRQPKAPLNNQCPVCATIVLPGSSPIVGLAHCPVCNNAFWQDVPPQQ